MSRDEPTLVGTEIGRYRIERELGRGGMGAVYLGVLPSIGSRVAIKVLSLQHVGERDLIERFFAEAKAVNLIRHESIVDVHDLGHLADGRPYIVMELVDGQTFGHIIRRSRPPLAAIGNLVIEVLSALAAAHAIGIVHRDLKPDNILVTALGHAKVLDFGIAKLASGRMLGLTHTGALLGTPAYMAPEQLVDASAVDGRADLYSAGIVLYEAITGRLPFTGSAYELMRAHAQDPPPPFALIRSDVPPAFEQIVATALEKQPARRFATAEAMAAALSTVIRALPDSQIRLQLVPSPPPPAAPSVVAPSVVTPSVVAPSVVAPSAHDTPPLLAPSIATNPPLPAPPPVASPPTATISLPWRWIGLGASCVVATAIAIGLVASSSSSTPEFSKSDPPKPTPPMPRMPVSPAAPTATPVSPAPRTVPTLTFDRSTFDPRRFDAIAFAKRADASVRAAMPDANLTSIQLHPVAGDGSVDLTQRKPKAPVTKLVFHSKTGGCLTIYPQLDGARVDFGTGCPETPVRLPRCQIPDLIRQSSAGNTGSVEITVTATYHQTRSGPAWTFAWSLDSNDVDDEC